MNVGRTWRFLFTSALLATLLLGFSNCDRQFSLKANDQGGIGGNPMTFLSIASYANPSGGSLNALNLCMSQLSLVPQDPSASAIQVDFTTLQELGVPASGMDLGALPIPLGSYSQAQLVLSNACGTQRSIGIVNGQGAFNSPQSVSLSFNGQIVIDGSPKKMTFDFQPIVNNLVQVNSNAVLPTQAAASPGVVTVTNIWTPGPTLTGAPSARDHAMSVWTGSTLVTWGGLIGTTWLGDGGVYDPSSDTWSAIASAGAPSARYESAFVWTGTEMIVWSGQTLATDGARYNPATNTWATMSTTGAPAARHSPATVWTGSQMLVWGGFNGSQSINTGGVYTPATDTWTAMSTVGAPPAAAFQDHNVAAVWTGTEMLVWGGEGAVGFQYVNTGGRYDPSTDSWSAIATTGAPSPRKNFTPIWTGTELIIWGGTNGDSYADGARYNPATDTWTAMSTLNAPSSRDTYGAVWTGSKMVVWGGGGNGIAAFNDGGIYDPTTDSWTSISNVNAPSARWDPTALWTGNDMLIWSGSTGGGAPDFNDGGVYVP